jgi:hypothetical protein
MYRPLVYYQWECISEEVRIFYRNYQSVGVAQVPPPERPRLILPADVPDREGQPRSCAPLSPR